MDLVLSPRSVCEFRLFNFRKIVLPHQHRQAVVHFQRRIPLSALNPAFPNFPGSISTPTPRQANQDRRSTQVGPSSTPQPPPSLSSSSPKTSLRFARRDESDLTNDRALPLPMPYPNSQPSSREDVEKMLACDPDVAVSDARAYVPRLWCSPLCQRSLIKLLYNKTSNNLFFCQNVQQVNLRSANFAGCMHGLETEHQSIGRSSPRP